MPVEPQAPGNSVRTVEEKPRSEVAWRPELTRLPRLTRSRLALRTFARWLARLLVWLLLKAEVHGVENVPSQGPLLTVTNHLGDADFVLGIACAPRMTDAMAKIELYEYPILGKLMDAYGVIWVRRGQADRRALRAALQGLAEGRMVALAPEGRESVTGALEEGTGGAAYLALKAGVPILPVTITGTDNKHIYGNMKRLRRSRVTLTIGKPFRLVEMDDRQKAIEKGTQTIMQTLAFQLPPEYQGVYR